MIITQTPLRISLAGGGTDFAGFYEKHGGAVLSTAIDKFIYVIIKARFDKKLRIGYTRATGGKIAGAGAGGFLLVFCPPDRQSSVRSALSELKELQFQLEVDGSKVIFNNRRT